MFSMLKEKFSKQPRTVAINGENHVVANPGETILQAGLRQNVRLPHNCRVGGCAECKCKLVSGKVKELTESAYVLSTEELDEGYILACQSVPKSNIEIQVDRLETNGPNHEVKTLRGEIVSHNRLTHDIVRIDIALPEPLAYASGQYAQLSLPGTIDQPRAYSFAAAESVAQESSSVSFFIREVPGGEMSTHMQNDSVIGSSVNVEGPHGDFWLREAEEPMLCVAGGSGLAPLKSLLEEAVANNTQRPVTFFFGARTQADLYCVADIEKLASAWPSDFHFIPVLSDEPRDSDWEGRRGFVTDAMEGNVSGNEKVYMCGPPPMIDATVTSLQALSINPTQIYFDKFLDQSHTPDAVA
ncbi:hypothetical protein A9Q99_23805 [Gammaproteobacteria bacterium 45_16_T64]|nr:hypothetical protein A9Q99_23805 [Gammaproteobacteria bacterium 45_16_T64]